MTAAPPPFPEAALRAVLAGIVAAWAGSPATAGDEPSAGDEPRRLYLDAFAGAEFQFGTGVERAADAETRAAAALRTLDEAGPAPPPVALFAEEDPAHLGRIYAELEDTAGERLRATRDLASLAAGEVSLLEAPFASVAGEVARFAAGGRTFAFLAPPAARALPWSALSPLAALPEATLLIRLPHSDFEKQSRHNSPLADLPGFVRRIVEGCSALLDDPKHAWLPAWRVAAAAGGDDAAMAGVAERFRALLDGVTAGRVLKPMELETKAGARTRLFLLTPDPAVALAANAAVRAAKLIDRAAASGPALETPPARSHAATTSPNAPAAASGSGDAGDSAADAAKPSRRMGRKATAPAPTTTGDAGGSITPEADALTADAPATPALDATTEAERALASSPIAGDAAPSSTATADDAGTIDEPVAPVSVPDAASAAMPEAATAPAESRPSTPLPVRPPAKAEPPPVAELLDLFPDQLKPAEPPEFALPDPAVLAAALEARYAGGTVAWGEISREFAATNVTPAELKAALAVLRRGGRAAYKALKKDDDAVAFPSEPVVREKSKRARKAASDDGFFGGGDAALEDGDSASSARAEGGRGE